MPNRFRRMRTKQQLDEAAQRKAARYSIVGRENELFVEQLLIKSGEFESVARHKPHSVDDHEGKDFTVGKRYQEVIVYRSFGVSISYKHVIESQQKHPGIPQFHVPVGGNPRTLLKHVRELFRECEGA